MDLHGCPWYVRLFWQSTAFIILVLETIVAKLHCIRRKRADLFWLSLYEQEKKEAKELEERKNKELAERMVRMAKTAQMIKDLKIR